jgi:flagellum-specific ATP synthase
VSGAVVEVSTSHYRVAGLSRFLKLGECVGVNVGDRVEIGEVVRIDDGSATLKPFDARSDITIGARAFRAETLSLTPRRTWKGRVIDALGRPIDGAGELLSGDRPAPLDAPPPPPLKRARVHAPLRTGVRVVDLFTPLCIGQRVGVFAGSGVGKSSLLAMLARAVSIDTVVVALVGERGREVREFLHDALGDNRSAAVAVVATGDESPMMRRLAPKTAMAVAEYFRDLGESVLLIIDSVTRFAHAARDVALAAGEPAVARGYAPSVFSDLPRLLERAGPGVGGSGSITGIFSFLVDGDDHNDPVADAIRGALDGHIVLDRAIADEGRYPAVNILSSVSRMTNPSWRPEQRKLVQSLRSMRGAVRGDARAAPDGRLHRRRRPGSRQGDQIGPAHLRGDEPDDGRVALRGPLYRPRRGAAQRIQNRRGLRKAMAPGQEVVIRAVGMALASLSMGFAMYMLAYGGGKKRINGMEHLAIFAQPRGPGGAVHVPAPPSADAPTAVDMAATGSLAASASQAAPEARPIEIVAAEAGRVWLKIDGGIRTAAPGESVAGLGRIGAIVARNGGWVLLDDKGKELLGVAKGANGAALFTRKRIFQ